MFSNAWLVDSWQAHFLRTALPRFFHEPTRSVSLIVLKTGSLLKFSSHKISILSILVVTLDDLINLVAIILIQTASCKVRCPNMQSTARNSVVLQVMMELGHHRLCQSQPSEIFLNGQTCDMAESFCTFHATP